MIKHAILIAALLPLAACASTTAPTEPATGPVASTSPQDMTCAQLAAAAKSEAADRAWARRQQQQTFGGGDTSNVTFSMPIGGSGGPSAGPRAGQPRGEQTTLREAMAAKGCT